ncbi:uncharacterized protein LOC123556118 [Mercenaria mercenaria]|uniref:uncharacterized protein LOC123556118 n=1 Tax=Mercenaria mercenaria TaxID=6596 RepID=UPI00234EFA27|nr:uncharacterized protein LOC123556118 [Mercenaria mercenaria]
MLLGYTYYFQYLTDKTVPEVAIRWLIQKKVVSSVIIGCTSVKQLEENMGASAGWELTTNQMKELNETHPVKKPYPYDFIWGVHNSTRMNRFNDSLTLL